MTYLRTAFAAGAAAAVLFALPLRANAQFTSDTDWAGADFTPPPGATIAGTHSNIGTFWVPAGTTVYVADWDGSAGGAAVINATTILIEGSLVADGTGWLGGLGNPGPSPMGDGSAGTGPGAGGGGQRGSYVGSSGGGGAGYGGMGGVGGDGEMTPGVGGGTYGTMSGMDVDMGSGGGAGGAHAQPGFECYVGGTGGDGGGALTLIASGTLTISGTVSANGGAGAGGPSCMYGPYSAGGGGGSGGGILMLVAGGSITGTVSANGGVGGTYGTNYGGIGGGGGGGGGRIKIIGSVDTTMATLSVTGGAAGANGGTAGANAPGLAGTTYTFSSTDPTATAIPNPVDFGDVPVGAMAGPTTLTIINTGGADLDISAITFGGPDAASFTLSGVPVSPPVTLAPTASLALTLTYAPTVQAAHSASVTVDSNDPFTPSLVVPVVGEGVIPGFAVTPAALSFGMVDVGTSSAPQFFYITNTGSGAVSVTGITIGGASAEYAITGLPATPYTLPAAASVPVSVVYNPVDLGADLATVTLTSNDPMNPMEVVDLDGSGVSGQLAPDPTMLDFGGWPVGMQSTPLTFTLDNIGTDTVVVSAIAVAGGTDPASFVVLVPPSLPATILPGGSLSMDLAFTPDAPGPASSYIAVTSDAPVTPLINVPLLGSGVTAMLTVTPTSLSFGAVPIGVPSPTMPINIANTGEADATITAATLAGATATAFAHDFPAAGVTLAPGDAVDVNVSMTPNSLGAFSATLTFATTVPSQPNVTVALMGSGAEPSGGLDSGAGGGSDAGPPDGGGRGGCHCRVATATPGARDSAAAGGAPLALLAALVLALRTSRRRPR
jgi:hypothetical protein